MKKFCEELAKIGQDEALKSYALMDDEGEKYNFHVDKGKWDGDTLILSASGEDIIFMEFGTGIIHNNGEHPLTAKFGYEPSSWSKSHEQNLIPPKVDNQGGRWKTSETGTKWFEGHAPAMGMWNASKEMREKIKSVAEEVFK